MENKAPLQITPQLIFGILIVVVGVLFTLDNLNVLNAGNYLRFWPAGVIALGLAKLVQSRGTPGRFAGIVIVSIGTLLLFDNLGHIDFEISDLWPVILVLIGASLVWQAFGPKQGLSLDPNSTVSAVAVMGGVVRNCNSRDFLGGELTAIMGGCELDLREAEMQGDEAVIQTFALWGGIEIKIPEHWTVVSKGFPLMGGFEDTTRPPKNNPQKHLIVKGFAIMGGVEIKN